MAILKWVSLIMVAMLMAVALSPIQIWLSLIQLPNNMAVVTTRGGIFNGSGVAEFAVDQQMHTASLSWQWCPSLGLTNWCIAIKQAGLDIDGSVAFWDSRIMIKAAALTVTEAYKIPGLAPRVFDLEGTGLIEELIVDINGCGLSYINAGKLSFDVSQAWIFGSSVGAIVIDLNTNNGRKNISAKGASVSATATLQANEYSLEAVLKPPSSLYNAMPLLLGASTEQNGVWTFNQQGVMPC
jgi:hypothetical protein